MKRILTGVQSTATPHIGNLLGAILPAIEMANKPQTESFLFIADFHSLTQIKEAKLLEQNTNQTAAVWLACGLDPSKTVFYRQSDVPEVTELMWYLNCFFPYQRLSLAHSFKDKASDIQQVNTGLFTYPMLMAADILLYDAQYVPVGKDQKQHIEFTRDVANRFNQKLGDTFVIPDAIIEKDNMLIPGTDGAKMSKSKNNIINIFASDKEVKKQVMGIKTDSLPLELPKDPKNCTVFKLYSLIADKTAVDKMEKKYLSGNYGYGNAKKELYNILLTRFSKERRLFDTYINDQKKMDAILLEGSQKARNVAQGVLRRVRKKLGYK